jgi:hypothetical protein
MDEHCAKKEDGSIKTFTANYTFEISTLTLLINSPLYNNSTIQSMYFTFQSHINPLLGTSNINTHQYYTKSPAIISPVPILQTIHQITQHLRQHSLLRLTTLLLFKYHFDQLILHNLQVLQKLPVFQVVLLSFHH